ncbi:MAG TPA: hypothetical protein VFB38_13875 [Chthonomonadaceae bacterium]|nr:hypothetical protein [Chthonomonadaceae bacterium]
MPRMQTLLTGFGPFGNVVSNPTERLIAHFAQAEVADHDLTTCLLPVSFARVPALLRAALEAGGRGGRPFENVLMLGVATGSKVWRVERFGRNWFGDTLPDSDGFQTSLCKIEVDGPEMLSSTLPVEALVAALERAGFPVIGSDSAGAFLCNLGLFVTLRHLERTGHPARAGFLHVPADDQTFKPGLASAPMFPFPQHVEAVRVVLSALAG